MPPKTPKPNNGANKKLAPKKKGPGKPLDTSWHAAFLKALEQSGNVRVSCKAAGVTSPNAYAHRARFQDFAEAWDNAAELAIDFLEVTARKRAAASSDTLLIFLLKAHRPEKYREQYKVEHSGNVGLNHGFDLDCWLDGLAAKIGAGQTAGGASTGSEGGTTV